MNPSNLAVPTGEVRQGLGLRRRNGAFWRAKAMLALTDDCRSQRNATIIPIAGRIAAYHVGDEVRTFAKGSGDKADYLPVQISRPEELPVYRSR